MEICLSFNRPSGVYCLMKFSAVNIDYQGCVDLTNKKEKPKVVLSGLDSLTARFVR